jgi:hypothetical protein
VIAKCYFPARARASLPAPRPYRLCAPSFIALKTSGRRTSAASTRASFAATAESQKSARSSDLLGPSPDELFSWHQVTSVKRIAAAPHREIPACACASLTDSDQDPVASSHFSPTNSLCFQGSSATRQLQDFCRPFLTRGVYETTSNVARWRVAQEPK